jgi:hypothetical protein
MGLGLGRITTYFKVKPECLKKQWLLATELHYFSWSGGQWLSGSREINAQVDFLKQYEITVVSELSCG